MNNQSHPTPPPPKKKTRVSPHDAPESKHTRCRKLKKQKTEYSRASIKNKALNMNHKHTSRGGRTPENLANSAADARSSQHCSRLRHQSTTPESTRPSGQWTSAGRRFLSTRIASTLRPRDTAVRWLRFSKGNTTTGRKGKANTARFFLQGSTTTREKKTKQYCSEAGFLEWLATPRVKKRLSTETRRRQNHHLLTHGGYLLCLSACR